LIAGRIDDSDHSLAPGMYVDVPDFDCLPIAPSITLKGLDHLILKPKKRETLRGERVGIDIRRVEVEGSRSAAW
jgi:hypothetical protein